MARWNTSSVPVLSYAKKEPLHQNGGRAVHVFREAGTHATPRAPSAAVGQIVKTVVRWRSSPVFGVSIRWRPFITTAVGSLRYVITTDTSLAQARACFRIDSIYKCTVAAASGAIRRFTRVVCTEKTAAWYHSAACLFCQGVLDAHWSRLT